MRLDILEEHAGEAMFLFEHRRRALTSLVLRRDFLREIDERLTAHLDGLTLARAAGWEVAAALLDAEEPAGPFVATAVALIGVPPGALEHIERALIAVEPPAFAAMSSALGLWPQALVAGSDRAVRWLERPEPRLRAAGITAFGAGGRPPPVAALARVLEDGASDATLLSAALHAAGRMGDRQLSLAATRLVAHPDAGVRAAALQAALLLTGAGARELSRERLAVDEDRSVAAHVLGFVGEPADAASLASALAGAAPSVERSILLALGNLGWADGIDPLLAAAGGDGVRARLAGFALARMLGEGRDWQRRPPASNVPAAPGGAHAGGDAQDADSERWTPDDELPLWSVEPIAAAAKAARAQLGAGQRLRNGRAWVAGALTPAPALGVEADEALEAALATPGSRVRDVAALDVRAPFAWRAVAPAPAPALAARSQRA